MELKQQFTKILICKSLTIGTFGKITIKFYIKQLIDFAIFHKEERNPSEINTFDFLSYEMGECSL